MAPATMPHPGRRSRLSGPLALATAAAAGYLATVGFAPSNSAWVGPAASRLGSRHRSVAAQAMADPETEVRGGRGMDYYDYDYDQAVGQRLAYCLQDLSPTSSASATPAAIRIQQARGFFPQPSAALGREPPSPTAGKPLSGGALAAYLLQSYA